MTKQKDDTVVEVEDKTSDDPFINPDRSVPSTYKELDFQRDCWQWIQEEPFLGQILAGISRNLDEKAPAAGYIGPRRFGKMWTFYTGYCPWRMQLLTQPERWGVFTHEMYHLILGHITTRMGVDKKYHKLDNIAKDLALNSVIADIPAQSNKKTVLPTGYALIPGVVPKGCKTEEEKNFFLNLPKLMTAEWYLEKLKQFQQKNGDDEGEGYVSFSGVGGLDSHDSWDQLPKEVQELLRQKMLQVIEKAVRKSDQSNSWGSIPSWMQEELRKLISGEIDWRSVLRWFVGMVRSQNRESTVKKINKKAPYLMPGAKRDMERTLACFIDQSGSMGDEDIALLFSELSGLANLCPIDCFHFDTEVDPDSHQKWTRQNAYPKLLRTRCGGTDFDAVSRFLSTSAVVKGKKWSGVIILTDGYAPTLGTCPYSKVLWVVTPGGTTESIREGDLVIKMTRDSEKKGAILKG